MGYTWVGEFLTRPSLTRERARGSMSYPRICLAAAAILALWPNGSGWPIGGEQAQAGGGWMFSTAQQPTAQQPTAQQSTAQTGSAATAQSRAGQSPAAQSPAAQSSAARSGAADAPREPRPTREPPGHIFGYPTRQDPLFDDGTRLPYQHQHLELPHWNRPSYAANMPQYVKPSFAQDPIRKPVYQRPLAVAPLDNKPKYNLKNYMAPSLVKPSYEFPTYMDRPNFVIKPAVKPAINRPGYDHSGIRYEPPVYEPPVYTPEEYKPPRFAPSPFIAPPR